MNGCLQRVVKPRSKYSLSLFMRDLSKINLYSGYDMALIEEDSRNEARRCLALTKLGRLFIWTLKFRPASGPRS